MPAPLDLAKGTIIGQPTVTDVCAVVNIKCTCGSVTLMAGKPGVIIKCINDECKYVFRMGNWPTLEPSGKVDMVLGIGRTE
jgi:hypothetical protein